MGNSIWDTVGRDAIIAAIKKFDNEKPNYYEKITYYLLFKGNLYPSKHIRRMAYKEVYPAHITFHRKSDGKPYVEPHHIIPMAKQENFTYSLDIPQNIVSLCSNCHNEVHYGMNGKSLIEKIYEKRKKELRNMHIYISLEKLLSYY